MSMDDIRRVVDEAVELGVSMILIAGGEPLMKQGILEIPKMHNDTLFVLFTNGLLMDDSIQSQIKHTKNLIPVLSIEGDMETTDARRGKGMYESILAKMRELAQKDIMFGSSITLTSQNYSSIIQSGYLDWLEDSGCAVSFLIEYVPQFENDPLVLEPEQKTDLTRQEVRLSQKHDMLVVALPGDEDKYGGCLAAGRGFLHISSEGSLEACPFAPYSDTNIKNMTLKQALKSKLMEEIRLNHNELTQARGGCALNENREWVQSLMAGK
jgi:MoaA/NifB/PqqE/SkfB family radical SAM enzyme